MKQLGILDSAFVNMEHPNTPQHVGGLGIYDPSTAPGGVVRFKGVIANFEKRLQNHDIFRSRLVRVPGDLDRPYWGMDANFDVEFHIRHIALPKPGDWRQLCIQIARLHARPLDMARPLWEAYIIEGLDQIPGVPKGGFAIYTKMHHSLVDGAGGSSIMAVIHDLQPDPEAVTPGPRTLRVDPLPSAASLSLSALRNQLSNSVKMLPNSIAVARDLGKMAWGMARKEIPMPPIRSPRTRFNTPVGPYRVFEATEFPLDEIKLIKNVANVKINDVMLAIVAGAMRRYLIHHDELPDESLTVSVPIDMRTRRGTSEDNNQIGSVFVSLCTHTPDPLQRLAEIHRGSQESKTFGEASPLADILVLNGIFAPVLTRSLINTYINNQLTTRMPLGISSVVSNVAGPPFPLYSAGAKLVRYYGMGVLTPGVGLFHTAYSSDGLITLSILGNRDAMGDPGFYRQCLDDAYQELLAATKALEDGAAKEGAAKKTRPKRKPAARKAKANQVVAGSPLTSAKSAQILAMKKTAASKGS